jgi:2-C-methyl-D-erythritol 4-phosphate cytidylyltransferase
MTKTAIITAGGIGKRMGSTIPKQFLMIHGKPLLCWTIQQFYDFDSQMQIIVSLPKEWIEFWENLCLENNFRIEHQLVEGGIERFHSIQNALSLAKGDLIAIHDGVRPLASQELIQNGFETAALKGSAIPVIGLKESIREVNGSLSCAAPRSNYRIVQTPQTFQKDIIHNAYKQMFDVKMTDDACLVENSGVAVELIDGETKNIKVTDQVDFALAELLLK